MYTKKVSYTSRAQTSYGTRLLNKSPRTTENSRKKNLCTQSVFSWIKGPHNFQLLKGVQNPIKIKEPGRTVNIKQLVADYPSLIFHLKFGQDLSNFGGSYTTSERCRHEMAVGHKHLPS